MLCKSHSLLAGFWILLMVCFLCSLAAAQGYGPGPAGAYPANGLPAIYTGTEPIIGMPHVMTLPGRQAVIRISLNNPVPVGSFDLILSFDAQILSFSFAQPIGELKRWESFTYRYSEEDTCGGACPVAFLRLIGVANMPDGVDPGPVYQPNGEIIELVFFISKDRSFIGLCPRVGFVWNDCQDNTFNSISGDTMYALAGLPDSCIARLAPKEVARMVAFQDGFICCNPPPDDRGDVNLNGVECEVGDAVLFANYFIFGSSVWDPIWFENQIFGTNINDDDQLLTLADLRCLIHIIADADWSCTWLGNGNPTSARDTAIVGTNFATGDRIDVSINSSSEVGAAAFVFRYAGVDIGKVTLADEYASMTIHSLAREGILRVLVYSSKGNSIIPGKHQLFTIPITGNGTIELVEAQTSSADGHVMRVNIVK